MKLIAGWFRRDRGLAIGVMIGALTRRDGVAAPVPGDRRRGGLDWRAVDRGGERRLLHRRRRRLAWRADRPVRRAVAPVLAADRGPRLSRSRRSGSPTSATSATCGSCSRCGRGSRSSSWRASRRRGDDPAVASLAAFIVVAGGIVGCVVAGAVADRVGRTTTTIAAMAASGTCAVLVGLVFGAAPALVLSLGIVWGVTIIADSAQFSAAVSELAPPGTAGSALSLQTAVGFVFTSITIILIGLLGTGRRAGVDGRLRAARPRTGRRDRGDVATAWTTRGAPHGERASMTRVAAWVDALEPDAPDIVAAWRGIDEGAFIAVRRRSGDGPAPARRSVWSPSWRPSPTRW